MSQTRRTQSFEDDKEEAEQEIKRITEPLRKSHPKAHSNIVNPVAPSYLGWKPDCPHCGKRLILTTGESGKYELTVSLEE